jgi:hypothetical protein
MKSVRVLNIKFLNYVSHDLTVVSHIEMEVITKGFRDKFHLHSFYSLDIIKVEEMSPEPKMMG